MNEDPNHESGPDSGHPILLPWFAAGTLDHEQARAIEAHLAECPQCREEVRELSSMRQTLIRERSMLELPSSGAADEREPQATPRNPWKAAFAVAAAAAVVLAVVAVDGLRGPADVAPGARQISSVTLSPTLRGDHVTPVLRGEGPWAVVVILPLSAPDGRYRMSLRRDTDGEASLLEREVVSDAEGKLALLIDALSASGAYRVVLESATAPDGTYVYPFHVERTD